MSFVEEEIASQPACWRRAAALATRLSAALPAKGQRVAILGCGTSWFVAQAMASLREATGHGETDAFAASEAPLGRRYDSVITLSRSGTTTEVLAAAEALVGTTTVAITADGSAPLAALTDRAIVLDFADERSVVQTRFATTVLALLRAHSATRWTSWRSTPRTRSRRRCRSRRPTSRSSGRSGASGSRARRR